MPIGFEFFRLKNRYFSCLQKITCNCFFPLNGFKNNLFWFRQRFSVFLKNFNNFFDRFIQFFENFNCIIAVNAAIHQFGTHSDKTIIFIAPTNDFFVQVGFFSQFFIDIFAYPSRAVPRRQEVPVKRVLPPFARR